jgi:hypothetical protein
MSLARMGAALTFLALVVAGCSESAESPSPSAGGDVAGLEGGEQAFRQLQGGGVSGSGSAAPSQLPALGPSVIKTARLELEVERDGFGPALDEATAVAAETGGFVVSSTTGGEESRRGSVVLRVPSDRFEEAMARLRGLGSTRGERISGEDVSQEFVDLEARLRNLEAQQAVLLRLFDQAATVTDTIRVQRELSGVQLQVEEIQGRLRYLRDQTSLATITVALAEEGSAAPGAFDNALDRAVDGSLAVIAGLLVALGYILPVAILGLVALLVARRLRGRSASPSG